MILNKRATIFYIFIYEKYKLYSLEIKIYFFININLIILYKCLFIIILNHLLLLEGQLWVIIFIIKMMEQEGIIIFLQIMVGCRQI
jgi:hypothetical protein